MNTKTVYTKSDWAVLPSVVYRSRRIFINDKPTKRSIRFLTLSFLRWTALITWI